MSHMVLIQNRNQLFQKYDTICPTPLKSAVSFTKKINEKFKLISNLVNSQIDTGEWGARTIQCGRIEISVCNETVIPIRGGRAAKKVGNGCWMEICKICDIPKNYMSEIVAYAKYISGVDKGSE